ncbi:transposase [Patescibacteria group bacterium]|nr:transposase [Patescibacteria group bacterium]
MKRMEFYNGQYCHIYNRGVDKRIIFDDKNDYQRFLKGMAVFNQINRKATCTLTRNNGYNKNTCRTKLVNIRCYCLMPNHFHILLQQNSDNGISHFFQRLGNGYTKYFNLKHKRTGRLFEGPYKIKQVTNERQLIYLTKYIHCNPLKLINKPHTNWDQINQFLRDYPWSSYADFLNSSGANNIVDPKWLDEEFMDQKSYQEFMK